MNLGCARGMNMAMNRVPARPVGDANPHRKTTPPKAILTQWGVAVSGPSVHAGVGRGGRQVVPPGDPQFQIAVVMNRI